MKKSDVQTALESVRDAERQWRKARDEFNSGVDAMVGLLIHEAARDYMSAEDVAALSGWPVRRVKQRMRDIGLDPRDGIKLLSRKAAEALENNAELLGIEPGEMDLTSPLAYLPMGEEMKRDLRAKAVSQVHEVSGNACCAKTWQEGCEAGENYQRGGPSPVNPHTTDDL